MNITREEAAIKSCEDRIKHLESAPLHHYGKRQRERTIELERIKISALSPITREQVEKVWRGEWEECFEDWRKQIVGDQCSECGFQNYGTSINHYNFCPSCGAPMTDEAVDMVMKRLEATKDEA